jgi:hypothetical protein
MPLLGQAAMVLSFDIVPEAITEHDDWHTHEHLPERLSIPGFVRGTRWISVRGQPRYLVLYEVEQLATLTSEAYLARLNDPSPWTSKMMPFYRGMSRGFCSVTGSFGVGLGHSCMLIRFKPAAGADSSLRAWLKGILPGLPAQSGIGSVHLLEGALTPAMTNEQRMRGADAGVDWALLLLGYSQGALASLVQGELGAAQLESQGATEVLDAMYRMDYTLADREVDG